MKKIYIFILIIFALASVEKSFGQKVAFFDTEYIMKEYNGAKDAKKELEKLAAQLDTVLARKQRSLDSKLKELEVLQKDETTLQIILEDKVKEVQDLDKEIRDFRQKSVQQLQVKENQLLSPILDKVQKAINAIGDAESYDFIIKKEALLHELPSEDISKKVLEKLKTMN